MIDQSKFILRWELLQPIFVVTVMIQIFLKIYVIRDEVIVGEKSSKGIEPVV